MTYFPDGRYYIGYSGKTEKQFEKYFGSSTLIKEHTNDDLYKEVIFEKDYDPSIPNVLTNKEQLIQTLINLVRNSIQALKYKGNVLIKTRSESSYTIGNKKYQLVAKIDVIDNGKGISFYDFKKIFDPGHTSKKRGWGLGLSLCKRIISEYHKGKIFVLKSNPFQETIFRIIIKK